MLNVFYTFVCVLSIVISEKMISFSERINEFNTKKMPMIRLFQRYTNIGRDMEKLFIQI